MDKEDSIKKLVESTIEEYKKQRNYNFTRKHPGLMENLVTILGAGILLVIVGASLFIATFNEQTDGLKDFAKTVIKDAPCSQLKTYLHDLNSQNADSFYNGADLIKDELTSRC